MRTPQASRLLAALLVATAGVSAMAQSGLGGTPDRPTVQAPPIDPNRSAAMQAQGGTPPPPPMGDRADRGRPDPARMEQMRAQHQQRMQQRLADQKQRLNITAAQAGAWQAYADAVSTPPAPPSVPMAQGQGPDEWRNLATPERLDRMRAQREAHNARADRQDTAVRNLYAALTPEQQKTFDADFSRYTDPSARPGKKPRPGNGPHEHGPRMRGADAGAPMPQGGAPVPPAAPAAR
jgi:hypothetical protein